MSFHKLAFAIAVATVAYTAVSGVTKAASIAPLPTIVTTNAGDITPVYYYRRHYYPYRWHGRYYHHRYYRHGGYRYYGRARAPYFGYARNW
jgi:hypothetical protein